MSDNTELKRVSMAIAQGSPLQGLEAEEAMYSFECAATPDKILSLIAENESLRKDAERYRWIKKESNLSDYEDCYSLPMVHAWEYKPGPELNEQFESLDAAIDHAISSPENPS